PGPESTQNRSWLVRPEQFWAHFQSSVWRSTVFGSLDCLGEYCPLHSNDSQQNLHHQAKSSSSKEIFITELNLHRKTIARDIQLTARLRNFHKLVRVSQKVRNYHTLRKFRK